MHRLVFLGPPGAGKGTQAVALAQILGIRHLSTGEVLRAAVAARTPLGERAGRYMAAGELVPDDLVVGLLAEELSSTRATNGFLLDGFPRTLPQALALERIAAVERVVFFDIDERGLMERLTNRRSCPTCGTVYNLVTNPPASADRCDRDGAALLQRNDDREEAVRTRLRVYREQTAPLLDHYAQRGVLRRIDAGGSVVEVAERVRGAVT